MNKGDLRVWWIPQIPMKAFHVPVKSISEAKLILNTLADYDLFQWRNKVKPDYSNESLSLRWARNALNHMWLEPMIAKFPMSGSARSLVPLPVNNC